MRKADHINNKLTLVINGIILVYMVTLASITCKNELWCAIAADVLFLAALTAYRIWRETRPTSQQASEKLSHLISHNLLLTRIDQGWSNCSIFVLTASCLYLSLDLTAFSLAACENLNASSALYRTIAPPVVLGLHPAFSLELLAGACIEAKSFARAEAIEISLLDIRRSVVGEKHELIAAMKANLGDLFAKERKWSDAERCYREAIELTCELRLPQGYGSPMTKLGTLLREEGRYDESAQCYRRAIAIRTKIFGAKSAKVGETLIEFAKLRDLQKFPIEAANIRRQAEATRFAAASKNENDAPNAIYSVLVALGSLLIFSQRTRIMTWILHRVGCSSTAS